MPACTATCREPASIETQVQGAAIMALATTLPTHRITLKDGVVEQSNFYDVAMPRMPDAPKVMAVHIVPSADAPKGLGEPGLPPLAPALANAVARLTGQRQRELPFSSPDAVRMPAHGHSSRCDGRGRLRQVRGRPRALRRAWRCPSSRVTPSMRRPASRRCRPASPHSTDRAGWLARLAEELAARPAGTVLSCSAPARLP
jgi:hypothetical protein